MVQNTPFGLEPFFRAAKTAYGFVVRAERDYGEVLPGHGWRLARGLLESSGRLDNTEAESLLSPNYMDVYDLPVQYPADDIDGRVADHLRFHDIGGMLKLNVLGHDDPT